MHRLLLAAAAIIGAAVLTRGPDAAPAAPASLPSMQERCEHRAERSARADASATDRLRIRAGSGSLEVRAVRGLDEVRVSAVACASSGRRLDELQVTADRSGSTVIVETRYPEEEDDGGWGDRYARLVLVVEVPADPEAGEWMDAEIDDTSGGMEISGLGDTRIDDSSGRIAVRNINGRLWIEDGSGEIRASDVGGAVEVYDGSGEIELRDVAGPVSIEDGSGEIEVSEVDGDVVVRDDGSGSIRVERVEGDFVVESDGSGGIRYRDVRGRVEIPPDGHRGRMR